MELNEKPSPTEVFIIVTIIKDEMIVAGVEYFLMPKKIGIRLMLLAAIAFIAMFTPFFIKISVVILSGLNLKKLLIT